MVFGLNSQDYLSDKVIEDTDLLYSGILEFPENFWETHGKNMKTWKEGIHSYYQLKGKTSSNLFLNEFLWSDGARLLFLFF